MKTPNRTGVLFLSFVMILVPLLQNTVQAKTLSHSAKTKKKKTVPKRTKAAPRWKTFSQEDEYTLQRPISWKLHSDGHAMIMTSPHTPDKQAIFGFTKRSQGPSPKKIVKKLMRDPDHPSDWKLETARIGDQVAIKLTGSKKDNPDVCVTRYYVGEGDRQYYILCQGPWSKWPEYSGYFNKILQSIHFAEPRQVASL